MQFYIKNESGEFVEANKEVDEEYKRRSDPIVGRRIAEKLEIELAKARPDFEKKVRSEVEESLRKTIAAEYEGKLAEADKKYAELDVAMRRKTIAAEYGFKPNVEEFLGSGTDEEMRAKADTLRANFNSAGNPSSMPEKGDGAPVSKIAQKTGLDIRI